MAALGEVVKRAQEREADDVPELVPVPRDRPLPLSFQQRSLWLASQVEGGDSSYNIPAGLELDGPLDPEALRRALGELVRRHEILRTVYHATEGEPVQVVRDAAPWELPRVDLSGLDEETRRRAAQRIARRYARRPFDLAAGPVIRSLLLRLQARRHRLLLVVHHIASVAVWCTRRSVEMQYCGSEVGR